jgi:hypothetical protein
MYPPCEASREELSAATDMRFASFWLISPSLFQINSKSSYRDVEPRQIAVRQSRFKTQPELWQAGNFYADNMTSKLLSVYTVE